MHTPCHKTSSSSSGLTFRYEVEPADSKLIRDLVKSTGKFYDDEIDIAVELVEERLHRGPGSGYEFIFLHSFEPVSCDHTLSDSIQDASSGSLPDSSSNESSPHPPDRFSGMASRLIGFACYGKIPCTREAYDLYWIAVHPQYQGRGLGHRLLAAVERSIGSAGGTQLYADTSGRPDYEATRRFYQASGFQRAACLNDFYAPGDDKVIFRKRL